MTYLKDKLRDLIIEANSAGRGRLDSTDWQEEDEKEFLDRLEEILKEHLPQAAMPAIPKRD